MFKRRRFRCATELCKYNSKVTNTIVYLLTCLVTRTTQKTTYKHAVIRTMSRLFVVWK